MKRIGIIDNLNNIEQFVNYQFSEASAQDVMNATGGNTGNIAFVHGVRKLIGNQLTRIGWGWDASVVRQKVDHLIICCANQLGEHVDLGGWADRLEAFGLPVTLFGIGAQADSMNVMPTLPPGTIRFLQVVKKLSIASESNIASRGEYSAKVINNQGVKANPLGCPSLHASPVKNLGEQILLRQNQSDLNKITVAAGNPWHGKSAPLEKKLCEIIDKYHGEYILQHPVSMVQYMYGERDAITENVRQRFSEVYGIDDFEELLSWYRKNASLYVEVGSWMLALKRSDFILGPRYHGVALGLQAGVPGTVIAIDSRTTELCQGTGIKYLQLEDTIRMSAEEIIQESKWTEEDATLFDDRRRVAAIGYTEFLTLNGLELSDHLKDLTK
ncbi:polysaccharide pyruvyl transferase family protein [Leclercia adecarboxylata]|uniref:Polysaccharide pyruvyl transferase family protein n=1 Tax=Leclercia adecarboxylata TaxID=83655 RepID=A0ABU6IBB1_9ENTR|nr:polysaccharide pyruvyl transferase family protein [Leclercia adecarboxylata]MEC3904375.1 polysaccharide pyruvyl transferase family protein [Leclercia adecarboxylata]MEC3938880.1 polysaccharide pyruvyl transferase family protein [Leclercia adecarboxylata]QEY53837.1 polysaccharide pyruvyl transferase family protein [Leclercia adecarboxylata]